MNLVVDGCFKVASIEEVDRSLDELAHARHQVIRVERSNQTYIQATRASSISLHLDYLDGKNSALMTCRAPVEFTRARSLIQSYLEGSDTWMTMTEWVPFSSSERIFDGGSRYSVSPSKLSYRQRMLLVFVSSILGLSIPFFVERPSFREFAFVLVMMVFFLATLGLPYYWAVMAPFHVSVIKNAINAQKNQEPFDRNEFKRACRFFRRNPEIRSLGQLPSSAAAPPEVLAQVERSLPQLATRSISGMRLAFSISSVVFLLIAIVRLLKVFLR